MSDTLIVTTESPPHAPPLIVTSVPQRAEPIRTPQPARTGKLLWIVAVLAAFGGGWMLSNRGGPAREMLTLPADESAARDAEAVMVTVEPVTYRTVQRTVEGVGTLHGFEEVSISAKVEGRIKKLHRDVADRVKPDTVLLEIEPTDYDLAVRQAEHAVDVELSKLGLPMLPDTSVDFSKIPSVMQAHTRMENAQSKQDRVRKLVASRASSEEELNNISSDVRAAQAEYAQQLLLARSGLAMIQMKQTDLEVARQKLKDTTIHAPTPTLAVPDASSGIHYAITSRAVSEGTFVRVGTEVYKLQIDQTLKLRVRIPERYSGEIANDLTADVMTAASSQTFVGKVTRVNPSVDAKTRTFEVEIQIPNPNAELKPGSFAKAAIRTRLDANAVTVPLNSLINFAGINKLFLLQDGKAKEVQVTLGPQTTDWAEVIQPVLPRDAQVITSGHTVLSSDTPVIISNPAPR